MLMENFRTCLSRLHITQLRKKTGLLAAESKTFLIFQKRVQGHVQGVLESLMTILLQSYCLVLWYKRVLNFGQQVAKFRERLLQQLFD